LDMDVERKSVASQLVDSVEEDTPATLRVLFAVIHPRDDRCLDEESVRTDAHLKVRGAILRFLENIDLQARTFQDLIQIELPKASSELAQIPRPQALFDVIATVRWKVSEPAINQMSDPSPVRMVSALDKPEFS